MATERIRGYALQKIRARVLRRDPLCVLCQDEGYAAVATQVDHIVPLYKDGAEHDSNRQGLCDSCHDKKTADDMGYVAKVGIDINGWPVE